MTPGAAVAARVALADIAAFSRLVAGRPLRRYQLEPARAIVDSVLQGRGLTFAVVMSRQAGKNETSAQIEAFLLCRRLRRGGTIVKAAPTYAPQLAVSQLRLETVLRNPWTAGALRRQGRDLRLGQARCRFLSAQPTANVVGATADLLLECDEAQDVDPAKWDRDFAPMGAATNVTTVFWGTVWTSTTLLARQVRSLRALEAADGVRRVFYTPWPAVAAELPAYRRYVEREVARLGADHPLIRTQYALIEVDGQVGLFPPERRQHMRGDHPRRRGPRPGARYVITVDVAGEAFDAAGTAGRSAEDGRPHRAAPTSGAVGAAPSGRPTRDATALTVFEIGTGDPLWSPTGGGPIYRVVDRRTWTGAPQTALYAEIVDLARAVWRARRVVIDATGLGAGLASFLRRALGDTVVTPFVFTGASKSALGWAFLALCDTGRFKDHVPDISPEFPDGSPEQALFWRQVEAAQGEPADGPGRRLRWSVPDPALHDDLLVSAALIAALDLDRDVAAPYRASEMVEAADVLEDIDRGGF